MLVQLALDRPNAQYTNLDVISGHIRLRVQSNTNVSSVVVKLEGESRTRLVPPSGPPSYNDRQKPEREIHKLLYKVRIYGPSCGGVVLMVWTGASGLASASLATRRSGMEYEELYVEFRTVQLSVRVQGM